MAVKKLQMTYIKLLMRGKMSGNRFNLLHTNSHIEGRIEEIKLFLNVYKRRPN